MKNAVVLFPQAIDEEKAKDVEDQFRIKLRGKKLGQETNLGTLRGMAAIVIAKAITASLKIIRRSFWLSSFSSCFSCRVVFPSGCSASAGRGVSAT